MQVDPVTPAETVGFLLFIRKTKDKKCKFSLDAPTPELLDACDSLGMPMLNEQRAHNLAKKFVQWKVSGNSAGW